MKIFRIIGWLPIYIMAVATASKLKPLSGDIDHVEVREIRTGHNRVQRSVGDCHFPSTLRFQFEIKDEKMVINLEKNEYLSRRVPLYVTTNGRTYKEEIKDENNFAAYQDVTRGSAMLVSCQKDGTFRLHGSFRYDGVMYHMSHSGVAEPTPVHYVQRNQGNTDRYRNDFVMPPDSVRDELRNSGGNSREKRADIPGGNIVELLFSIDRKLYDNFYEFQGGDDTAAKLAIEQYAALLANEIDLLFCSVDMVDPSLSIKIYLVGVEFPEVGSDVSWSTNSQVVSDGVTYINVNSILSKLRLWYNGESGLPQHDHLMALSTLDLADITSNPINTGVEGVAYVGTVCSSTYKVSFTEVDGSRVANIAAHELGHGLGSNHDGSGDSSACSSDDKNIMTVVGSTTTNLAYAEAQWTFSSCSVAAFKSFIDGLGTNCMTDHAFSGQEFEALQAKSLPGTVYSLDQQCQLYNGQWSSSCDNNLSEGDCYGGYHCSTSANLPSGCSTSYFPLYPLAGTPCGSPGDNKWCYRGLCLARSTETTTSTTISTSTSTSPTTSSTTICTTSSTSTTSPTTSTTTSTSTTSPTTSTTTSTSTTSPTTSTTTSTSTTSPTTSTTTSTSTTSPTTSTTTSTSTTSPTTSTTTSTSTTSPTTSTTISTSTISPTTSTTTSPSTTTPTPCNTGERCCKRVNRRRRCCTGSQCCSNAWAADTLCYSSCCASVDTTTTTTSTTSTTTTPSTTTTTPTPCNTGEQCCKRVNRRRRCCTGSQCCSNPWAADTSCYSSCCASVDTTTTTTPTTSTTTTTTTTPTPCDTGEQCCKRVNRRRRCCTGSQCCSNTWATDTSCYSSCCGTTTTLPLTTTTTDVPCHTGKCCAKVMKGKKLKKVCCKGKKCCRQSWAFDTVCVKTCC